MYLEKSCRIPTVIDPWILRLFKLQIGSNGLRDLEIEVHPGAGDGLVLPWNLIPPLQPMIHNASADRLKTRLHEIIKTRADAYMKIQRTKDKSDDRQILRSNEHE